MVIHLDESTHTYTLDGRVLPSVTQALSVIERGFAFVDPIVLEAARQFGTNVHLAISYWNDGVLKESTLDAELRRYLFQYKRFLKDTGFEPVESERIVHHERLRYAGKLDVKGNWKRSTYLLDLKSGAVPRTVGPQTAAYQQAHPEPPLRRACLQLMRDDYRLKILDDPSDWSVFVSALNCYRFIHPRLEAISHGIKENNRRA